MNMSIPGLVLVFNSTTRPTSLLTEGLSLYFSFYSGCMCFYVLVKRDMPTQIQNDNEIMIILAPAHTRKKGRLRKANIE